MAFVMQGGVLEVTPDDPINEIIRALKCDMPKAVVEAWPFEDGHFIFKIVWPGFYGKPRKVRQEHARRIARATNPALVEMIDGWMTFLPEEIEDEDY